MKEYFLTNKEECNLPATIGTWGKVKSFFFFLTFSFFCDTIEKKANKAQNDNDTFQIAMYELYMYICSFAIYIVCAKHANWKLQRLSSLISPSLK